nr:ribonuclease H-like domain-containing protein [Tanacetum cinerariifolium]
MFYLFLCVDRWLVVEDPQTAKEAWDLIALIFNYNKRTALKAELRSLKLGDLSIDAYFRKIESIATILTSLGYPISNDDVFTIAFEGLPDKYDNVFGIIIQRDPISNLKMDPTTGNWYMDTDASSHLNDFVSSLSVIFNLCIYPSVSDGDNYSIPVIDSGHSILPTPHRPLHLNNVLITPNIVKNLIYVRQLVRENHCTTVFDAFGFFVKDFMTRQEFSMTDLGSLTYFLGISITRDSSGMFLCQRKYATEIFDQAHMVNCNLTRTPVDTYFKLGDDDDPVPDPTLYRCLEVQHVCLYMQDPRKPHISALKWILRVCLLLASTIVFMGREPRYYISDNVLESMEDFPGFNTYPWDYESMQPWCVDSFKYFNNLHEPGLRDSVGDVLVEVVKPKHKLMCFGGDNAVEQKPKQVDSNNHSDVHAEDQDSSFQNMDMDANIHSDVHVEEQNSPVMDKEDILAVFDDIKATVHIIDKRKGEVATFCLVKELDLVKDRIAMIEKAWKLRYQESSEDSVQQLCYKQHELGGFKGSVGFDNVLDPSCKDEFDDDNDQEGLVKLVDDLCIEEHISGNVVDAKVVDEKVLDDKVLDEKVLEEKVLDAKVVDEKGQAISRLTATEDQQPPSDHQVQPDADWAIADPYFCPLVMGKDEPFWPANGVNYPIPWTEVDR